jgi:hypothetical protein
MTLNDIDLVRIPVMAIALANEELGGEQIPLR